jgi:hypothetical protein
MIFQGKSTPNFMLYGFPPALAVIIPYMVAWVITML